MQPGGYSQLSPLKDVHSPLIPTSPLSSIHEHALAAPGDAAQKSGVKRVSGGAGEA